MSSTSRYRPEPSAQDLAKWSVVKHDLLDWLYTGLTGRFQIAGHRQIHRWGGAHTGSTVVEVGCGHGHHLQFGGECYRCFIGLDIEIKYLRTLRQRFPKACVLNGDAYALPFKDSSVDCVLSVYNLEHLRNLAVCLAEFRRVLKPQGELLVGLPAEGALLYEIGRKFTSRRYMERKYGIDYEAIVRWEHWNTCEEVIEAMRRQFRIVSSRYIPFYIPSVHLNVIVVLRASPLAA